MSTPSLPSFSVAFPEYSHACSAVPDATHVPRHFSLSYESRRCGRLHEALVKLESAAAKLAPWRQSWRQRHAETAPPCAAIRIDSVACELEELHQRLSSSPPPKRAASATAQQCSHCGLSDTPEWRRGPSGSRTLCNACGLFFSKLTRKFGSASAQSIMRQRQRYGRVHDRKVPPTAA